MSRTVQTQLFLLVLIFGFLAGPQVMQALQSEDQNVAGDSAGVSQTASVQGVDNVSETSSAEESISLDPYKKLSLEAKSVYVWDINTHRVLYGKDDHKLLPLASVTKMMMAVVAVELLPQDKKVTITALDLSEEGDNGLYVGENWSLSKLLDFTLVASSNDGASAIASVAGATLVRNATTSDPFTNKKFFIEKMNEKAKSIGLTDTYFSNESGLDIDSVTGGAYGTARDMAMLFEYIFKKHPYLFSATTYSKIDVKSENDIVHHVANTNEGVDVVSGLIGSKTGYTDLAGGNLVVLVDIGVDHPVVIAVLGSSRVGRFTDVQKLIDATIMTITQGESGNSTPVENNI